MPVHLGALQAGFKITQEKNFFLQNNSELFLYTTVHVK